MTPNNTKSSYDFNRVFAQISRDLRQNDVLARHTYLKHKQVTQQLNLLCKGVQEGRYSRLHWRWFGIPDVIHFIKKETIRCLPFSSFYDQWHDRITLLVALLEASPFPYSPNSLYFFAGKERITNSGFQPNSFERILELRQQNKTVLQGFEDTLTLFEVNTPKDFFFEFSVNVYEIREARTFDAELKDTTLRLFGIMEKKCADRVDTLIGDFITEVKKTPTTDLPTPSWRLGGIPTNSKLKTWRDTYQLQADDLEG